jgi:hypothetical protein
MSSLEQALARTVSWVLPALLVMPALLAWPRPDDPFGLFIGHLAVLVGFGVALAVDLTRFVDSEDWFRGWAPGRRRWGAVATLVALDAGAVGLLTLASSAALGFDPSLQFLQLLSALDIAWAGAAIALGAYLKWGSRAAAWIGGSVLGVVCLFSIWRYLDAVGFAADGGWKVSGSDLMTYVIPFDMAAAAVAVFIVWMGVHAGLRTEHPRLQS